MKESLHKELVDLVDANGVIQQHSIPRTETDLHHNLHLQIVVAVLKNSQGQVLVQRRALSKKSEPGSIDHVCGAVWSGETPEDAALRESTEETGLKPQNLRVILQGINIYNRYRYLLSGEVEGEPKGDFKEVEWVRFYNPEELRSYSLSGDMTFVDEFFEDLELVVGSTEV